VTVLLALAVELDELDGDRRDRLVVERGELDEPVDRVVVLERVPGQCDEQRAVVVAALAPVGLGAWRPPTPSVAPTAPIEPGAWPCVAVLGAAPCAIICCRCASIIARSEVETSPKIVAPPLPPCQLATRGMWPTNTCWPGTSATGWPGISARPSTHVPLLDP